MKPKLPVVKSRVPNWVAAGFAVCPPDPPYDIKEHLRNVCKLTSSAVQIQQGCQLSALVYIGEKKKNY